MRYFVSSYSFKNRKVTTIRCVAHLDIYRIEDAILANLNYCFDTKYSVLWRILNYKTIYRESERFEVK